ncbi:HlyC/CorC family transporter [Glaciecola sp. MH2013]|uniref:CNNM domain-containing protein n=1 Tax=Glaciecola sp. MH2013 TaxID=2785524 RepID=UPI00189D56DC|nr:hemolysin family protein [Glaciecola sp. MH2013]MBF7071786.1 HlyC/CorC family transporter [Glaciecola sp. MH2013]
MFLLIVYVLIALGFSFICSIAEAVILSVSQAYISLLEKEKKASGPLLAKLTGDINKPLSAILTLNTIAHTMGAAGAGAQAAAVFGDAYLGVISAVLTFLILVFSEIIPKTLGATFWRQLAPVTAHFLKYLIIVLYPFVKMSQKLTSGFTEESPLKGLSRSELLAMAELSGQEGQLAKQESRFLKNLLQLHELSVKDAMTHRTVVFSAPESMTVNQFMEEKMPIEFSRIPVYEDEHRENISGFVLKSDILIAKAYGENEKTLSEMSNSLPTVLSDMPLSSTFDQFLKSRVHMVLVVDEYGGLEGILTLEDLLESLLGVQIVDESDTNVSMKQLAKVMWRRREQRLMSKDTEDSSS